MFRPGTDGCSDLAVSELAGLLPRGAGSEDGRRWQAAAPTRHRPSSGMTMALLNMCDHPSEKFGEVRRAKDVPVGSPRIHALSQQKQHRAEKGHQSCRVSPPERASTTG